MIHLLILLFPLFYSVRAQQTFYPPAIPLVVRSPYLSCWMFTLDGTNLAQQWPTVSAHQPSANSNQDADLNVGQFFCARYHINFGYSVTLEL